MFCCINPGTASIGQGLSDLKLQEAVQKSSRISFDHLFHDKISSFSIVMIQILHFFRSAGSNNSTSNSDATVARDSLLSKNIKEFKEQIITGLKVTSNGHFNHIQPLGMCIENTLRLSQLRQLPFWDLDSFSHENPRIEDFTISSILIHRGTSRFTQQCCLTNL